MGSEPNVILYTAMSLDGYIAKEDGSVDWLEDTGEGVEGTYLKFYISIDTIIMGRKTYDQILTFGEWVYKGKDTYVLTSDISRVPEKPNIEFRNDEIEDLTTELKQKSKSNIWLLGGAETVNAFLEKKLIDEYRIAIVPVILGTGIPLFTSGAEENLDFKQVTEYDGIVELKYEKKKIKIANFEINNNKKKKQEELNEKSNINFDISNRITGIFRRKCKNI